VSTLNIIRLIQFWSIRETRNAYKIVGGKSEGNGTLGRPTRIWENNIRMDLRETGWEVVDCMHLVEDTEYGNTIKCGEFPD
jgi:hypothetical protein